MSRAIDEAVETMRGLRSAGIISEPTLRDFETQAHVKHESTAQPTSERITESVKAPDPALMNEVGSKVPIGITWTRDELYDRGFR